MINSTFYRLTNGCIMDKHLIFNLIDNLADKVVALLNPRFYWFYADNIFNESN